MIINSKFHNAIAIRQNKPFVWGENDCALFVADIYLDVSGIDLAEGIRGLYNTKYDGVRLIVDLGGWDEILVLRGFEKINTNMVKRGDVVISENALGIWIGDKGLFAGGAVKKLEDITDAYHHNTL